MWRLQLHLSRRCWWAAHRGQAPGRLDAKMSCKSSFLHIALGQEHLYSHTTRSIVVALILNFLHIAQCLVLHTGSSRLDVHTSLEGCLLISAHLHNPHYTDPTGRALHYRKENPARVRQVLATFLSLCRALQPLSYRRHTRHPAHVQPRYRTLPHTPSFAPRCWSAVSHTSPEHKHCTTCSLFWAAAR